MEHWRLDDIPWDRFDPTRVNADHVKIVKAASMVESQARDYAAYLCDVFRDDPEFQKVAREWAEEEVQHGEALAHWAKLADPSFDYAFSLARFTRGHRLPATTGVSVRGSRTGELLARCVVETGTSSYYTALRETTEEPVLKELCRQIAADELRHYKLFYTHVKRYQSRERVPLWRRMWVVFGRVAETDDDELAYAFHCGNGAPAPYDRARSRREYAARAYPLYRPHNVARVVAMLFKAVGLNPWGRLSRTVSWIGRRILSRRIRRWQAAAA